MLQQRLRDTREDHDKTQEQIAKVLGIKQNVYSRYETGKNEIPVHHLKTLCIYYNISADYLIGLIDQPKRI